MSELDNENDYAIVFDHFYTTNHIQILKSLLPFLPKDKPSYMPVLIKYMELQYTISITQKGMFPIEHGIKAASSKEPNIEQLYHSIKKYLAPDEEKNFQQIINMMHSMENVKEMQKMMELFQSMSETGADSSNSFPDLSNLTNIMGGNMNMDNIMGGNMNMEDMMQLFNIMNKNN